MATDAPAYCLKCDAQAPAHLPTCPDAPSNVWGPASGLTPEDIAHLFDDAKARRVRSFSLETTMRGHPVKLSAQFEAPEKGPRRE